MALNLKRKVEKSYSLDEMMYIVNKNFIENARNRPSDYDTVERFAIEPTCHDRDEDRWIVCDSRATNAAAAIAHQPKLLPTYYGKTILEAVTRCFLDRDNHYPEHKYDLNAFGEIPVEPRAKKNG